MARIALAAASVAVIALVAVLLVKARPDSGGIGGASAPSVATGAGTSPAGEGGSPSSGGTSPLAHREPIRLSEAAAAPEPSALPAPDEVAEARARVIEEFERAPSLAPEILDQNYKAKPMRDARKSFARGDYPTALARAEDALAVEPDSHSARVVAVMSACAMNDAAVAQAHADKLDDLRKTRVARRCRQYGIMIKNVRPVDEHQ
jgi:hypothetical protein